MSWIITLLSDQLINTAKARIATLEGRTEADLRRAVSDLYYALFHRICEALVSPIAVDPANSASVETFKTLYRLPDHGFLEKRCREINSKSFSNGINAFAQQLVAFKNKRQTADYDPLSRFSISSVENDLKLVETIIKGFDEADALEQTRFAFFVALKPTR